LGKIDALTGGITQDDGVASESAFFSYAGRPPLTPGHILPMLNLCLLIAIHCAARNRTFLDRAVRAVLTVDFA
jgi:hypothetical protein